MKNVLYVGWVGYKNLGDELMLDLFREQFNTLGNGYHLAAANIEHKFLKNVPIQPYDLIVLGGGSILSGYQHPIHPYIINYLYQCSLLNKKIMIWGSGIDWAPKSFIEQLDRNEQVPVAIPEHLKTRLNTVFEKSVWSGVRGPLTQKILEQSGVKTSHISGDPGFLLDPGNLSSEDHVELDSSLVDQKIIGVNWGTSFNNIYGQDEERVENELADALNQFLRQDYHIYLYTVWQADIPAIERLYYKLEDHSKVTFDRTLYNHNQLLSLLQNFYFTINFKLHANYLSLAANVPFIAFGYRFKMYDFVKSVEQEEFIIGTDEENINEKILSMEAKITTNTSDIKTNLKSKLNFYRDRIGEPFKHGLYI